MIENLGALERRVDVNVSGSEIAAEVARRLASLARDTTLPGFRRGKVPVRLMEQRHGAQVRAEVLSDSVGRQLAATLEAAGGLRIAGAPQIVPAGQGEGGAQRFSATFEVYPEVPALDAASLELSRAVCPVGDAEVDKTLAVMRRQRASLALAERAAADGDRVTIDFRGTIDGVPFEGGTATDYPFDLGAGRMLPQFEAAIPGHAAGQTCTALVEFPADYHGAEVAGRTASFEITVRRVEERVLPEIDAAFALAVGVADGSLATLRDEVRANVEREVGARLRARTRESVMAALGARATFPVPRALVQEEQQRLQQMAQAEIDTRGGGQQPALEVFAAAAEQRVRLSLLLGELVRNEALQPRPEQVRAAVETMARGYERPAEVVQWILGDRNRVADIENTVAEDNVIAWALSRGRVTDLAVAFDDLMGGARA